MNRKRYMQYMAERNASGSNKASSYVRALDLVGPILSQSKHFKDCSLIWNIQSTERIGELYYYIIEQQKLGAAGIFDPKYKPSYWRSGFYSAALKSYQEFLVLHRYENDLWSLYSEETLTPDRLSRRLTTKANAAAKELACIQEADFTAPEGKETLREIKTRVNQDFFRKLIMAVYESRCCICGLDVPAVLRASHIAAWSDNAENRLNPANGLCLSATHDAAFDRFLISVDDNYRVILSPALKEHYANKAFQEQFKCFEGRRIAVPKRFLPDPEFLGRHRERLLT